ncbi:MAG: T9SS type A sorting domain-containing protein [Bacteroidia bacterium]|nr:T9SS type A sorting domain-containing protein [Bacteroidia bacterium]
MKKKTQLLTLPAIFLSLAISAEGQVAFEKHEVAKPFTQSAGLGLADVDQDGDLDILAGSGLTGLFWIENQGGKPLKWLSHTVDASIKRCLSVAARDIDKDGKTDLVATSWNDNSLFWYRNLGNQVWEKRLISNQCGEAHELFVWDMDGDGFDDALVAAVTNNEVLLFHNPGPASTIWPKLQITNSFSGSRTVAAGDLDGDGKADIVGGAFAGNKITIWHNLGGNPVQWQPFDLVTGFTGAHRVEVVDLNQDGKLDIIGWAYSAGLLKWWENTGSDFSGWIVHTVDNQLNTSCVGEAKDMDLDGDLDIVTTGYLSNQVVWYENTDGKALTWRKRTIDTGLVQPWMAFAGDLDGDLDMDVVAGGDSGNEIRWYENHPAGRMDSYLNYSGGKMNTGIFLPEGYSETSVYELLIALPGEGDSKSFSMFRDYLIPVSESRNTIILTPDFPGAVQPDYQFANPLQINEIISYAKTRFSIDTARIYLMGAACQGKPVLQGTQAGIYKVKGAIAVNPEIQSFLAAEWSGKTSSPLAIASSLSNQYYPNVEAFADRLWQDGKLIKLFSFNGPESDYMIDELPDLTIRCMNYIDSANYLNHREDMPNNNFNQSSVSIIGSGMNTRIRITAIPGEHLYVRVIDINGRILYPIYQGPMIDRVMDLTVNSDNLSLKSGIYLISVTGSQSGTSAIKVFLN